ncbi:MAG: hypothetical protein LBO06_08935 [Bacteroidales bacterium]|jgi:hypothetical protein|nr:hypothetical protein [Bacteroidales bacterium]
MFKRFLCFALLASGLNFAAKAQEYYEFIHGDFQLGLGASLDLAFANGWSDEMTSPFFVEIMPELYVSYDVNDWFKFIAEPRYSLSLGGDIDLSHFIKIPILGIVKIGRGYLGAGLQQNVALSLAAPLKGYNMNALYGIVEICWAMSKATRYAYDERGFHPTLRIGCSVNKVGIGGYTGRQFFVESGIRWNLLNTSASKYKKASRTRR